MKCLAIFALVCVAFAAAELFDEDGSGDLSVSCSYRNLLLQFKTSTSDEKETEPHASQEMKLQSSKLIPSMKIEVNFLLLSIKEFPSFCLKF